MFIRESAGLRVVRTRHEQRRPYWHAVSCLITEAAGFGRLVLASAELAGHRYQLAPDLVLGEPVQREIA